MPGGTKPPVGPLAHEVARIIRGHLARIGWTHGELGARVDISASQISRMLRGHRHMDVDQLDRICTALNLRVVDVLSEAERTIALTEAVDRATELQREVESLDTQDQQAKTA